MNYTLSEPDSSNGDFLYLTLDTCHLTLDSGHLHVQWPDELHPRRAGHAVLPVLSFRSARLRPDTPAGHDPGPEPGIPGVPGQRAGHCQGRSR